MYLYMFAHFQYTQCSESNEPTSSTKFSLLPTKMYVLHAACLNQLQLCCNCIHGTGLLQVWQYDVARCIWIAAAAAAAAAAVKTHLHYIQ